MIGSVLLWAAEFVALPLIWAYLYWLGIAHWPAHILYGVASVAWPVFLLREAGVFDHEQHNVPAAQTQTRQRPHAGPGADATGRGVEGDDRRRSVRS